MEGLAGYGSSEDEGDTSGKDKRERDDSETETQPESKKSKVEELPPLPSMFETELPTKKATVNSSSQKGVSRSLIPPQLW